LVITGLLVSIVVVNLVFGLQLFSSSTENIPADVLTNVEPQVGSVASYEEDMVAQTKDCNDHEGDHQMWELMKDLNLDHMIYDCQSTVGFVSLIQVENCETTLGEIMDHHGYREDMLDTPNLKLKELCPASCHACREKSVTIYQKKLNHGELKIYTPNDEEVLETRVANNFPQYETLQYQEISLAGPECTDNMGDHEIFDFMQHIYLSAVIYDCKSLLHKLEVLGGDDCDSTLREIGDRHRFKGVSEPHVRIKDICPVSCNACHDQSVENFRRRRLNQTMLNYELCGCDKCYPKNPPFEGFECSSPHLSAAMCILVLIVMFLQN